MTWGMQNTEEDAHAQIEYALSRGINFLDTAEMYPVPSSAPGHRPGRSEEYIGSWLKKHPERREDLVIATKITGYNPRSKTAANRKDGGFEGGDWPDARLSAVQVKEACEASLKRLDTSYIDLYQLHWPDRYVPSFGARTYIPELERESVPIKETLSALKELLKEGKIKAYGLSNETTFGVCEFVRIADELDMPRPATIQNPFCLLNRQFEAELAEACAPRNFNIGLLPWSILAGGLLSGKYNGKVDSALNTTDEALQNARFIKFKGFMGRFLNDTTLGVSEKYIKLAERKGISVATLAQAFCKSRWYIPSSIIGATTMEQLKENINAFDIDLDKETIAAIDEIHNSSKDLVVKA